MTTRFKKKPNNAGFTLIELMVVVVIVAIIAAIAIPSYQEYVRRSLASQAQQQIQQISNSLEKNKARNFNYLGFTLSPNPTVLPVGATGASIKYSITVQDGANTARALTDSSAAGQSWVIRAESTDAKNFSYLMTSLGFRCKTKTTANISATSVTNATCGTGGESW
ncbi:prepilin-type N-terminal cleavage/methylation domain-containing protein [Acinetobacter tibetensis]|jgi:type IV pilus assembly protein PilE|uniref:Prepilin-type N-terminal cleavage/methylation domain-containing protein n=1 Tax=Acinetobacter tibetensis TaxID=2943497 RepID=A0AAE9LRW7_9GAMM|nr:prepilin-type N-terminal cleavage/methylation domain-containing protein [Acinetobacter tibetensis]USE83529.1 prepilin-type N-terminal cleavage/methylation domain-containing protein [Acinetobacter tibetensis]